MAGLKCPGQDTMFWKPENVSEHPCPHCGKSVELWKDDVSRRCPHCKKRIPNPAFDPGCAKWCRFAGQCTAVRNAPPANSSSPDRRRPDE